jgi:hypothetical protein
MRLVEVGCPRRLSVITTFEHVRNQAEPAERWSIDVT